MTEARWLKTADAEAMWNAMGGLFPGLGLEDREMKLLIHATCRPAMDHAPAACRDLLDRIGESADGPFKGGETSAWNRADKAAKGLDDVENLLFAIGYCDYTLAWGDAARIVGAAAGPEGSEAYAAAYRREEARHADCIRDIFGNPFRPVAADPSWATPSVVRLAQSIYDGRAFARMPKLADALERAGCTHADVLDHCRGPGPHVRGCWVVDLLLSKR